MNARALRPPLPDGLRDPGRRRARHRPAQLRRASPTQCDALEAEVRALQGRLRRPRRAAGPLHHLRAPRARARATASASSASPAARAARRWTARADPGAEPYDRARGAHGDAAQRRRGRARHGALRGDLRVAAAPAGSSSRACRSARSRRPLPHRRRPRARPRLGRRLARRGVRSRSRRTGRHDPALPSRTTRRGRTGRCSSTRCIGNIVPDFPLINKSFNLSYSGHDL